MVEISRRSALKLAALSGLVACSADSDTDSAQSPSDDGTGTSTGSSEETSDAVSRPQLSDLPAYEPSPAFPEGILSGQPTSDSIVFWTKVSEDVAAPQDHIEVELALEPEFRETIASASSDLTYGEGHQTTSQSKASTRGTAAGFGDRLVRQPGGLVWS